MKLKYKIPLLFLIAMGLIILFTAVYYRLYFIPRYLGNSQFANSMASEKEQDIVARLKQMYPDVSAMTAELEREPRVADVSFALIQADKRTEIFAKHAPHDTAIVFQFHSLIEMDDGAVYGLDIDYVLNWQDFNINGLRQRGYITLSLILLAGVPLLALLFHLFVGKSLYDLHRLTEGISLRNPELPRKLTRRRDEIGELYVSFSRMSSRIRQAREEQAETITAIAHDLKTPLTVLSGCNERLLTQPETNRGEADRTMQRKIAEMSELLSDFSSFARNELEMNAAEFVAVDIRPFFESIVREYEDELDGFGYRLSGSHELPDLAVRMNERMIRRVFANLIGNAVRYRKDDELEVVMTAAARKNEVEFVVGDNGTGVPEAEWGAIFKRFYRVEKSRQREHGGTGLGLAICYRIVEQHGGTIAAGRSAAGGLEIRIVLPAGDG